MGFWVWATPILQQYNMQVLHLSYALAAAYEKGHLETLDDQSTEIKSLHRGVGQGNFKKISSQDTIQYHWEVGRICQNTYSFFSLCSAVHK